MTVLMKREPPADSVGEPITERGGSSADVTPGDREIIEEVRAWELRHVSSRPEVALYAMRRLADRLEAAIAKASGR